MSSLLLWLSLPLLLSPWLAGERRAGGSVGRLIVVGVGLAALHQGAGTLDPGDLRLIANQSPPDAWFVTITAGVIIASGCDFGLITRRTWWRGLPALPVVIGLLFVALAHPGPLSVGLVVGAVPSLVGKLRSGPGAVAPVADQLPGAPLDRGALLIGLGTIIAALIAPALLALAGLGAVPWQAWLHHRGAGGSRRVPVREVTATLLLIAWGWFAFTIAGSWLVSLPTIAGEAPVSPVAGRVLALLTIGWASVVAAPWPIDRPDRIAVQLPVVAVVLHFAGVMVTPDGIAHWQPLVSSVLVASALVAVAMARWDGATAALMLLAATRNGALAGLAGAMMAMVPFIRRLRLPEGLRGTMAAVATGLVAVVLLRDQVLLAVILTLGIASLATRRDTVVARVPRPVSL